MLMAHPFLGFTVRPGTVVRDHIGVERARRLAEPGSFETADAWLDVRANNHGFYSPVDYPWRPPSGDSTRLIGLFGGSVTQFLSLQLDRELALDVEASGAWPSDRAMVLNFADGGMKQPQNLVALTYFLSLGQRLDAAVLIDGFGPAALSFQNARLGYAPEAPSITHLRQVEDDVSRFELRGTLDPSDESAVAERIVDARGSARHACSTRPVARRRSRSFTSSSRTSTTDRADRRPWSRVARRCPTRSSGAASRSCFRAYDEAAVTLTRDGVP